VGRGIRHHAGIWLFGGDEVVNHHTTICVGTVSHLDPEILKVQPGADLYYVAGADVQEQIDSALLEDLHCYRTVVFVGGEAAKREAEAYGVVWIEDTPAVNEELLEFWRTTPAVCDSP
jgi:hypothetical protein